MKIFDVITIFLIGGCLYLTGIQGYSHNDFDKIISEKCEINAGQEARNLYQELGMWFGMYCLYSSEISPLNIGRLNTSVQIACANRPTVKKCTKYATNLFRPCLKLEEQASMDIIYNVTSSYMDFMCQHEEFFDAVSDNREECVASNARALDTCTDKSFGSYAPDDSPVKDLATGIYARLRKPFIIDIEDCLTMRKFQNCSVQVLQSCQNQTSATLLDSTMNSIIDATPCKKMLVAQISSTTELGLAPVELLERIIRQKCDKNGVSSSSETAINGLRSLSNCFTTLMNATRFKAEVISAAAASPSELDALFKSYSRKVPTFAQCIKNVVDSIEPCLISEEREIMNIIYKIVTSWLENIVHDQGDRNTA